LNPVVHFEVVGKDAKKLQEFYGRLFDWKINADNPMQYGLVEASDGGIGGGISAGNGDESWVTVYVQVKDPQEYLDRAVSLGGKVVMPVTVIPGMVTMAQFTDPEGHLVGIVAEETPQ
jgi:predicted enzyme related to lactoylglutathione lyase